MKEPEDYGFYETNLGVLYFEDVWTEPCEHGPWEPVDQESVTEWVNLKSDTRNEVDIKWNTSKTQLQAPIWWVGSLSESDIYTGLYYWTICSGLRGYANSKEEAINTIERLIKSDRLYNYNIIEEFT